MQDFFKIVTKKTLLILSFGVLLLGFFALTMGQTTKVKAQTSSVTEWIKTPSASFRILSASSPKTGQHKDVKWAAIQVALHNGAKTYWRSPGETGVPPSFDWSKSTNLKSAKVLWPAPHRFKEADSMAVGYDSDLTLPLKITAKDPSQPVILKLDLFMGICTEICIPVQQKLALTLPAQFAGETNLETVLKTVPKILTTEQGTKHLHKISLIKEGGKSKLAIEVVFAKGSDSSTQDLFVEAPEEFYIPLSQFKKDTGTSKLYTIDLADIEKPESLIGKPLKITMTDNQGALELNTAIK